MKMTPEKKVACIIATAMILMVVVFIAAVHYLKTLFNLPTLVLFACCVPILVLGQNFLSKWLLKSKWKDIVLEMEKKCVAEDAKSKPRARMVDLAIIAILSLWYSLSLGSGVVEDIIMYQNELNCFSEVVAPNIVNVVTLFSCSVLIAMIAYNVYKKNVFVRSNARLISAIGMILLFSVAIQRCYWDATPMLPNDTVAINFGLLAVFILFFGRIFGIGVKMQEEQDLTI